MEKLQYDKLVELIEFSNFLYYEASRTSVDIGSLLIQQESLKKIWYNPEEDIYNLNE